MYLIISANLADTLHAHNILVFCSRLELQLLHDMEPIPTSAILSLNIWYLLRKFMSFNIPNPSLLGIFLVISTHSGPTLVFLYPPELSSDKILSQRRNHHEDDADYNDQNNVPEEQKTHASVEDDDEGLSSEESDFSDEQFLLNEEWDSRNVNYYMGTKKDLMSYLDDEEKRRRSNGKGRLRAPVSPELQPVISQENSSPSSTNLKKTVSEVSDSQKSSSSRNSGSNRKSSSAQTPKEKILGFDKEYLCELLCPPRLMCNTRFEITVDEHVFIGLPVHCYDNGLWRHKTKAKSTRSGSKVSADGHLYEDSQSSNSTLRATMSMFHLVFIMDPPVVEYNYRVDEMFHFVISRLALVLRYEQLKHDYVWKQVKLISKLKEDFRLSQGNDEGLHEFLVNRSSLCRLIKDCFEAISKFDIANLFVNKKLRSFQIPIKTEFHSLPEPTVPHLPGSYLSTTVNLLAGTGLINIGETTRYGMQGLLSSVTPGTSYDADEDSLQTDSGSKTDDIIYFSLLLLDDPNSIIRDINAEPQSAIARFIHSIKPTESLERLAHKLNYHEKMESNIADVKSFAFHLVYWRRARVIQPLSSRSVYIVSPMAPLSFNLYNDIKAFKAAFSSLPSLPHFLKLLSALGRKPKQFATAIPSKDHRDIYIEALGWLMKYGYVTQLHTFVWLKISKKIKMKVEEDIEKESAGRKGSNPVTPIVEKDHKLLATDNTSKAYGDGPSDASIRRTRANKSLSLPSSGIGAANSNPYNTEIVLEKDGDTIILDPGRASPLERKWINKIIFDECKLTPVMVSVFYKFLKYMNGKNSLELLLLKENVSRHDLRKLMFAIEDHIISVRHW